MPAIATTLSTLAPARLGYGWGPGPWFLVFPLFWLLAVTALVIVVSRRRRAWGAGHFLGPWGASGYGGPSIAGSRSARGVLAERFARGEIDETEFRARLEVLLAADRPSVS